MWVNKLSNNTHRLNRGASVFLTFLLYQYLRPLSPRCCSHWSCSLSLGLGAAGSFGSAGGDGGGGGLPAASMLGLSQVVSPDMALCQYRLPSLSLVYSFQCAARACFGRMSGGDGCSGRECGEFANLFTLSLMMSAYSTAFVPKPPLSPVALSVAVELARFWWRLFRAFLGSTLRRMPPATRGWLVKACHGTPRPQSVRNNENNVGRNAWRLVSLVFLSARYTYLTFRQPAISGRKQASALTRTCFHIASAATPDAGLKAGAGGRFGAEALILARPAGAAGAAGAAGTARYSGGLFAALWFLSSPASSIRTRASREYAQQQKQKKGRNEAARGSKNAYLRRSRPLPISIRGRARCCSCLPHQKRLS